MIHNLYNFTNNGSSSPIQENPGNPIFMNESVQQENQQFGSFDSFSALLSLSVVLRFYFVSSEPSQMAGASDEALT